MTGTRRTWSLAAWCWLACSSALGQEPREREPVEPVEPVEPAPPADTPLPTEGTSVGPDRAAVTDGPVEEESTEAEPEVADATDVGTASAQQASSADADVEVLANKSLEELLSISLEVESTMVTSARYSQRIEEIPTFTWTISSQRMDALGYLDLKDLFKIMPGVDVSHNLFGEVRTSALMRGIYGNQKILLLQDGLRASPITGEKVLYAHNYPLFFYKKVEVMYGPSSALYGPDAYAGVVNMILKDGGDIGGASLRVNYLDSGAVEGALLVGDRSDAGVEYMAGARVFTGDDYDVFSEYKEYREFTRQYSGDLAGLETNRPIRNWNLVFKTTKGNWTLGGDWQHELEQVSAGTLGTILNYSADALWGQDIRHAFLQHDVTLVPQLKLKSLIEFGDYEVNPASNYQTYTSNSFAGDFSSVQSGYKYAFSRYAKGTVQAQWTPVEKLAVVAGASADRIQSFSKTDDLDTGPYRLNRGFREDFSEGAFPDIDPTSGLVHNQHNGFGRIRNDIKSYDLSFYAQASWQPLDNLSGIVGGRTDYNSIYGFVANPRLGLVWEVIPKLRLKSAFGTAYIQPSNYARNEHFVNPVIAGLPNFDLEPETMKNVSTLIEYQGIDDLTLRLSAYYNRLDRVIEQVPVGPEYNDGDRYYNPLAPLAGSPEPYVDVVLINQNSGRIDTYGGETTAQYSFKGFLADVSYAYVDGEVAATKHHLAKVAPHKFLFSLAYLTELLQGSIVARYVTETLTLKSNAAYGDAGDKSYSFDGSFTVDANLSYAVLPSLALRLNVQNIFDTRYYSFSEQDESSWQLPRVPQDGRRLMAGVRVDY